MQLTEFTDYSLRVLLYTGLKQKRATVTEIARNFRISQNHLVKVVHFLSSKGWVMSYKGRGGGVELAARALDLTVGEVVRATEPHMNLLECFEPKTNTCPLIGVCHLERALLRAHKAFMSELDAITFRDLVKARKNDPRLERLNLLEHRRHT